MVDHRAGAVLLQLLVDSPTPGVVVVPRGSIIKTRLVAALLNRVRSGYSYSISVRARGHNALPKLHGPKRGDAALLCPMRHTTSHAVPSLRHSSSDGTKNSTV